MSLSTTERQSLTLSQLAAMVDRCAELRAQVDDLTDEKRELEARLAATGLPTIEGTQHTVSISRDLVKKTVDWKSIAAKFDPSVQLVTAYTSYGNPYYAVRYSARKLPS
jgi:hypothetical protein